MSLEVAGPLAMFARPDTGGTPTSYPAPTWSVAKGIFEAIAFLPGGDAWFHPTSLAICKPRGSPGGHIAFQRYTTNYGGPGRKTKNVQEGTALQIFANVLANVCYRIEAEVRGPGGQAGRNPRHHLQDLFNRRLRQGRCFRTPCLGWSEFTCDYWGLFRPDWEVDDQIDLVIPSMLHSVWDHPAQGDYAPRFTQGMRISQGVLTYAE
ncbi:MAG: CRISPR-associated protein Cas5 [Thermomicrobiales bacterium]|nr:CRISPR-associated protein Cas5 [Thermomicrobiales bacterium]